MRLTLLIKDGEKIWDICIKYINIWIKSRFSTTSQSKSLIRRWFHYSTAFWDQTSQKKVKDSKDMNMPLHFCFLHALPPLHLFVCLPYWSTFVFFFCLFLCFLCNLFTFLLFYIFVFWHYFVFQANIWRVSMFVFWLSFIFQQLSASSVTNHFHLLVHVFHLSKTGY